MRIKLVTGRMLAIAEHTIPEFGAPPKVVIWGNRVFILDTKFDDLTYMEVFAHYILAGPEL